MRASSTNRVQPLALAFLLAAGTGPLANPSRAQAAPPVAGGAFGASVPDFSLFGGAQPPFGPEPTVTLPAAGSATPVTATDPSVTATAGPATLFSAGTTSVSTGGTPGGTVNSSTSITSTTQSTGRCPGSETSCVYAGAFSADAVGSTCEAAGAVNRASTTFTNGQLVTATNTGGTATATVAIPSNPPRNDTIEGSYYVGASDLETFTYTFNEQTVNSNGTITVTAGHEVYHGPAAKGDVLFGQAVCGVGVSAVAALPAMSNGAYGGYVTAATIQNVGSAPATVGIGYFDQSGAPVGPGDTTATLPVNASWTVRQDNGDAFPTGGAGSAIVYSDQPVASFVNEFAPGNVGDATSYTGIPMPSGSGATLYAPTIVNNAYGGYTTGIGLLNLGGRSTDVTITYRDATGAAIKTQTVTALAANAYSALYSGDPTLALPSGFAGTATIVSSGRPLGAIVNETGPGGQFSSYDAAPAGATSLDAPVALNNAFGGYYTGMGVQNTSATAGNVSIAYYDSSGALAGAAHSFPIEARGSLGVYQGSATDGPPAGAFTAVIQSTLPLAAVVNEVAPAGPGSARQSTSYNPFPAGSATLHLPLVENTGTDSWNTGEGIMNTGSAGTTVTVTYYNAASGAAVGTPQASPLAPKAFLGIYQPDAGSGLPSGSRATAVVSTSSGGQVAVITNESSPTMFMSYDGQ